MVSRMSAIASFHVLPKRYLPQLVQEPYETTLEFGREPDDDYGWSGYCVVHVLTYLSDRGVDLFETPHKAEADQLNDNDCFTLLLTAEHQRYVAQLDPADHDEEALAEHFALMGYAFEEAGIAGREAIELLRDQIASLTADEILVVRVS